ncbi:hypothetical protein QQZ08_008322 [Neonectria magnoliae]|uniref:Rhodopsin domain-containing protein n=1 Tax=Neonectria magnoliae TaxID=2732573 RepID=A0ABR1HVH9_9HYPO
MAVPEVFLPIKGFVRAEFIVNSIIVFIVLVVVSLRVTGRVLGPGLGWDDGMVLIATPLGVVMLVCQGFFAPIGNGYNLAKHPELMANVPFILQLTFCMQVVYVTLLASVKGSMLCFFIRVFPTRFMQSASKIALGFVGLWLVSYLCACIFLCKPVSAQWTGLGKCGVYMPMIQSLIATNALGDLIIMALPMHSIWSLQTRNCVVCAIFRLMYISTVDLNGNITGTMPTTIFLFILEPNLAILCVSIPMLRPFYAKYKRRMGGSKLQEYSDERSTGFRDRSRSGQESKARMGSPPDNATTWEMDDYYPPGKGGHGTTVVGLGDESGSEKNLTSSSRPRDEIRVETEWAITRR